MTRPFADLMEERPFPPADAPASVRMAYLRDFVRIYARELATLQLVGAPPGDWETEVYCAVIQRGQRIGASPPEIHFAATNEWKDATERARKFLDALRARLWPLGKMHAPSDHIIAAARAVAQQHGDTLPDGLLIEQAKQIIQAALPRARPVYGRPF